MTDKTTIVNLLPGQVYDIRSPDRKMRMYFPEGKSKSDTTRITLRDLGTWVEPPPVEPPPVTPPPVEPPPATIPPNVPTSIDKTGATDASAPLNAWIASLPNGSVVSFPAGGIYRLNGQGLVVTGKTGLKFYGNGATLKAYGDPGSNRSSTICLYGADADILIDGFKLIGNGSGLYKAGGQYENQHGVCSFGTAKLEVRNCTISNTWGDGVYITNSEMGNGVYPASEDVSIHDNSFSLIGRMGIAVISAKRVTAERNSFDKMSLDVLDIEPDWPAPRNAVEDIVFRSNTIGTYAHSDLYRSHCLAITGSTTTVKNVTMDNNTVTGGRVVNSKNDKAGFTAICWDKGTARVNVRITNNKSSIVGPANSLGFQHVETLVITGNQQPVSAPPLAWIENCTNVTKDF